MIGDYVVSLFYITVFTSCGDLWHRAQRAMCVGTIAYYPKSSRNKTHEIPCAAAFQ